MPLLKKKVFEKTSLPEYLRDDEEVFYCEITNEIFRDYEEFCERMFLCNSMVWTCSMTGRTNFTYAEALESEENARKSLKEFPSELKMPMLFIANLTRRTAFGDMADDVFLFVKDRYFIGENVETSFTGNKWKDSHVLQVIEPTEQQIRNASKNGNTGDRHLGLPPASLYKYEIEHLDAEDKDISEIMIVDFNHIRRKKGSYSRDKNKLFLKQYVEQDPNGIFVIKKSTLDSFGINTIKFNQIYIGSMPKFEISKKFDKIVNGKKTKQETLTKLFSKQQNEQHNNNNNDNHKNNKVNLLEQMKKRAEEFKLKKEQKKEEELIAKQKKKEENLIISGHIKDWYKPKEDLELEDQKPLPNLNRVNLRVPEKYVGDTFMVLEFVNSFSKLLSTKDFFPEGLTLDILERALIETEVAGPLTDIIQMFLTALFNVQDEEASQYKTKIESTSNIKEEDVPDNLSLYEATRLATLASSWSLKYQGLPLGKLPLYTLTVSEILRLHLLSSGARINDLGAKWRFQERGGYTSEDDPGLYLRLHQPHILKALAYHNVVQLTISDKLKILSCLINQLLTYADVRDIIDERIEKNKQAKNDLKLTQIIEKKREQEYLTAKLKLKRDLKEDTELDEKLKQLDCENDSRKFDNEKKIKELSKLVYDKQSLIGQDRAYRKYFKLESIPGVLVNFEDDNAGLCLSNIVKQKPELINADRRKITEYIKENLDNKNRKNCLIKINGFNNTINDNENNLLICTNDPLNCIVHSTKIKRTKWSFIYENQQLDELCDSLNKRGIRENELYQAIITDKICIQNCIQLTPIKLLNSGIDSKLHNLRLSSGKTRYEDTNLGYPTDTPIEEVLHVTMVDNILEMEKKIFVGNLGSLLVKDREAWRKCLIKKNYQELDKTIIKREQFKKTDGVKNNSRPNTPEINSITTVTDIYQDPGRFLGATLDISADDIEVDDNDILLMQPDHIREIIKSLSIALAQVAQAVDVKYLKKPLGHADRGRSDKKRDVLDKWEQSLLSSTNFSQIFLHYRILDSCVMWSKSVTLARCKICRKLKDSESMLLCDSCDLGFHLYCLKPQLTAIPEGDWFCKKCLKKRRKDEVPVEVEKPRKRRRIFREEEEEEEEEIQESNHSEHEESLENYTNQNGIIHDDNDDNDNEDKGEEAEDSESVELCKTCGSGGDLICCEMCSIMYHIECVSPPLRRVPRGSWYCSHCKEKKERRRRHSESEDDEVENRRSSHRRDECRDDLPLHNAALHDLLSEIMKDNDAWPFLRPVQKIEVPDYYDVITKPMDFGTIKYKLNMGEYSMDAQLMSDVVLVFQNCNTYNHTDDDVYKCGVKLLKHFQKKTRELGLQLPIELDYDDDTAKPPKKKKRTK